MFISLIFNEPISLTLIRFGFLKLVFSSGRTNPNSVQLRTIVKQSMWSKLKLSICWHHLSYVDVISFKMSKKEISKNPKKLFIYSERLEGFQSHFQ